ncbi:MAG: hypothetical protein N2444_03415, partial [Methylocystis sp.]|nr:hypothetical protein [Methylocystis sp.]
MRSLAVKTALGAIFLSGAVAASPATAMPALNGASAVKEPAATIEKAGWDCGPWGCYRRHWGGYYAGYGYPP